MVRKKIYINGFEWWLEIINNTPFIYISETSQDGLSIYSKDITKNEREQVLNIIKYGK